MRFSFDTLTILSCVSLSCVSLSCVSGGAAAWAADEGSLRQKLFEMDKAAALAGFDAMQKQACLKALHSRYQSRYTLSDALAFNEPLSLGAYDRLFWKGQGNVHRGLIFTGSVTDPSGARAGSVVCYYATTDDRLDFQSAYVMPREVTVASSGHGMVQALLISKE